MDKDLITVQNLLNNYHLLTSVSWPKLHCLLICPVINFVFPLSTASLSPYVTYMTILKVIPHATGY